MLWYNFLVILDWSIPQWIVLTAIKPLLWCFIFVTESDINNNKNCIQGANMLLSRESELDLLETKGSL